MTITINFPQDTESVLNKEAQVRGQDIQDIIIEIVKDRIEEDRELGALAMQEKENGMIGHEESMNLLNQIKNA